jgi:hypothetical protein
MIIILNGRRNNVAQGTLVLTACQQQRSPLKTIFIESDLSSFADFHDKEWFAKLFATVEESALLEPVEDFSAHWWGASRSFVLPWLYVTGVYDAVNSTVPIIETTKQDLWNDFLKVYAFKASLWKISECSFCAIYYAYENLLVRLLASVTGRSLRVTDRNFTKDFIGAYGSVVAGQLWTSNFISVSREIRNCITHNSGKATKRLLTMRPLPMVAKGDVLISASGVRTLYTRLKPVVLRAIDESLRRL